MDETNNGAQSPQPTFPAPSSVEQAMDAPVNRPQLPAGIGSLLGGFAAKPPLQPLAPRPRQDGVFPGLGGAFPGLGGERNQNDFVSSLMRVATETARRKADTLGIPGFGESAAAAPSANWGESVARSILGGDGRSPDLATQPAASPAAAVPIPAARPEVDANGGYLYNGISVTLPGGIDLNDRRAVDAAMSERNDLIDMINSVDEEWRS